MGRKAEKSRSNRDAGPLGSAWYVRRRGPVETRRGASDATAVGFPACMAWRLPQAGD